MAKSAEHLEQLTAYLDGELSPEQHDEVDRLLAEDEAARTLLDELRRTARLVGSLPRGRAPADLAEQVTARMEREALLGDSSTGLSPTRRGVPWGRGFALAASFALVCTAAWYGVPELTKRFEPTRREPIQLADNRGRDEALEKETAMLASKSEAEMSAEPANPAPPTELKGLAYSESTRGDAPTRVALADREKTAMPPSTPQFFLKKGEGEESQLPRKRKIAASPSETRQGSLPPKDTMAAGEPTLLAAGRAGAKRGTIAGSINQTSDLKIAPTPADNRIIVESADRSMVRRQVALIEGFMAGNSIQNIRASGPAAPIAVDQQFYQFDVAESPDGDEDAEAASSTNAAGEVRVSFRIREDLAPPLLGAIQQQAIDQNKEIRWIANESSQKQTKLPRVVLRQLEILEAGGFGDDADDETIAVVGGRSIPTVEGPHRDGETVDDGMKQEVKSDLSKEARERRRASPTRPSTYPRAIPSKKVDSIDNGARLITWALSLRARSDDAAGPVRGAGRIAGRRGRTRRARTTPTTQGVPSTQPTSSPPATTQGSSRG